MLEGKGAILDVARAASVAVNAAGIDAAVIGGIAVVLHHHIRTTVDVDLLVNGPLSEVSDCLQAAGATVSLGSMGVPPMIAVIRDFGRNSAQITTSGLHSTG